MALTVIPIALIYVVILGIGLVTATRRSVAVTEREMSQLVSTLAERFDGELRRVANAAEITARTAVTLDQLSEEEIYLLLENSVREDQLIYGAAMAFVPLGFDGRQAFSPYVHRDGELIRRLDIAGAYDYLNDRAQEWWRTPAEAGKSGWTEPYFDEGAGCYLTIGSTATVDS